MNFEIFLFYGLGAIAIASSLLMITRRNPVYSALFLIYTLFCFAGLYLMLHAQFIAFVHVIVYTGAIMVLFVFVIMLLNLGKESKVSERFDWKRIIAVVLGLVVALELIAVLLTRLQFPVQQAQNAVEMGTVQNIGKVLFSDFLLPFELTSLVLIAAIIGAIILAKKKLE